MVCAKCEKKERELGLGLVTADVWKPIGKGNDERSDVGSRKIGENKLLSSKRESNPSWTTLLYPHACEANVSSRILIIHAINRKMKMQPYMIPDMKSKISKKSSSSSRDDLGEGSSSSFAGGAVSQCKKCKSKVAKTGAKYCQGCAYKDGICSMCGTEVLKNKSQYKMSSK